MVGFFLRRRLGRFAAFGGAIALISLLELQPAAADITYTYDASGLVANNLDTFSVSVSITTDGNIGPLLAGDIVSWEWTATDNVTNVTASSNSGASLAFTTLHGDLDATSESLSLLDPGDLLSIGDSNAGGEFVRWRNIGGAIFFQGQFNAESNETAWNIPTTNPIANPIATVPTPEPSTLALFSGLGALGMLVEWRRRKRVPAP